MHHRKATPLAPLRRLLLACLLGVLTVTGAVGVASAQDKATDWAASDVKGRSVDVKAYRGKVLLVFIMSDTTKDLMRPITEDMVLRYGHNPKVAQVSLADFSDAPFTWKSAEKISGTVTDKTKAAHDRSVKRIQKILKDNGKPPIPGLDKKIHIVLDWDQKLVKKYKHWNPKKFITVVVTNPQGDIVGSWKLGPGKDGVTDQLKPVYEAVDSTLGK